MGNRRASQSGFSSVFVLLSIIVVAVIAASGAAVYHYHTKNNATETSKTRLTSPGQTSKQNTNQQTGTRTPSANRTNNIFTIPELNAKITLPDGLTSSDLKYSIGTSTGEPVANFTTSSLEQMNGTDSCSTVQAPIGVIWRTSQDPSSGSVTVKQIGQYYYAFERPQGSCTGNPNAGSLEQSQIVLLKQAFETITTVN